MTALTSLAIRTLVLARVSAQIEDLLPEQPHITLYAHGPVDISFHRAPINDAVPALGRIAERLNTDLTRHDWSSRERGASVGWQAVTTIDGVQLTISSPHYPALAAHDGYAYVLDDHGALGAFPVDRLPHGWHWATELDHLPAEVVTA